jgi:tRNA(Ile)-lysidine synthase
MPGLARSRHRAADPADRALLDALERSVAREAPGSHAASLAAPAGQAAEFARPARGAPLLVACSGGPDSMVLLDLASRLQRGHAAGWRHVRAVHVHHGLQQCADDWASHCERECAARAIPLQVERVEVGRARGIEAGAREARYAALARVAASLGARAVLTAHHLDDRIETFLLQWLRGAGPEGLAGIASARELEAGACEVGTRLLRPLLEVPRSALLAYAERNGVVAIHDPSNDDMRLARNALRSLVMPALGRIRPGFRRSAARSIDLVAESADVLRDLAREDLAACREDAPDGMLRLDRLAAFAPARQSATLRAWLQEQGIEAPPRARLAQALAQALGGSSDTKMLVRLGERELRRYRGLLVLRQGRRAARTKEALLWRGDREIAVPSWGGLLRFEPAGDAEGVEPEWLREKPLELRARSGGERFKPHLTRPSRRLKQLFQEAGIPEFERTALPLVWREDRLLFVPGLGMDARLLGSGPGRVRLEWVGEGEFPGT